MTLTKVRVFPALIIFTAAMISGCGGDSSGPSTGTIDPNGALSSLSLGLQGVGVFGDATTPVPNATFGGIAPQLGQVTVTLDGAAQGMYALGLRESFPAGTCQETLFVTAFPSPPGTCTPPLLQVLLILWQAHSATQPPDRIILIVTDAGTSSFDFENTPLGSTPALAFSIDGTNDVWSSISGSITTQTTATNQTCDLPLPPYAKSGACTFATFNEQGSIVFEPFSLNVPSTQRRNLVIPSTSLHGLWVNITEILPVPLTGNRFAPGWAPNDLARAIAARLAARAIPAR